jgi:hypothetical protein
MTAGFNTADRAQTSGVDGSKSALDTCTADLYGEDSKDDDHEMTDTEACCVPDPMCKAPVSR